LSRNRGVVAASYTAKRMLDEPPLMVRTHEGMRSIRPWIPHIMQQVGRERGDLLQLWMMPPIGQQAGTPGRA